MSSAPTLLSRAILGVSAACLLLAGCADASRPVASEDQTALSSSTTQPNASAVSTTSMPPATSTSSTSTLPSETPSAEDIFAERASQLAGDESVPEEPDIQLINLLLNLLSPEAPNSPTPEWLTQQQITQLSDEIDTLSVDFSSEVNKALLKYIEVEQICVDSGETDIVLSECSQELIEVCSNLAALETQLIESKVTYFSSLWSDIKQIICYVSDSFESINYTQEALERCSEIWTMDDLGGIFQIEFSWNQTNLPHSYVIPIQGEFEQVIELLKECLDEYNNFCLEVTNWQTRLKDLPTWFLENYVSNESNELLYDVSVLANNTIIVCQSAEIFSDLVDFFEGTLVFLDTCQGINPFENEYSDEPSLAKLNMQYKNIVFLVQSTTDEELIEECFQVIQRICSNIKSLIMKMEELTEIDQEFDELVEMYSSIETIYCNLADIFLQE